MKTTSFSSFCRGFAAALLLGLAPWNAQAFIGDYFNVDFEGDTIGQAPTQAPQAPLPTATQFTGISGTVPNLFVTNNLFGNLTQFTYFDTVGANTPTMTAQIADADQPSQGTLRVAMDLAASSLVTTSFWMPLSFDSGQITFDFVENGKFRVVNALDQTNDFGEYHPGQFKNIDFRIDLDSMTFSVLSVQGSTTNVLLAGISAGPVGTKFQSITPGPVGSTTDYQFGIDNVVIEMLPEPNSACLSLAGGALLAAIFRRRRSH